MARRQQNGFTLIEVLVVLLIIAIIAAAASLQLGILDSPRQAQTALASLENALPAIRTRAILQPAILGVFFSERGYKVKRMWIDPKDQTIKWHSIRNDHLSNPQAWSSNVKMIWHTQMFGPKTNNDVNKNKKSIGENVFIILSNGLVSPGKLEVLWKGKQHNTIKITAAGIKQTNAKTTS